MSSFAVWITMFITGILELLTDEPILIAEPPLQPKQSMVETFKFCTSH